MLYQMLGAWVSGNAYQPEKDGVVTQNESVNLSSLNLVSDELVITIEQAAGKLEQYVSNRQDQEALEQCIAAIEQITGTLRLIQLDGGQALASEILDATRSIGDLAEDSEALLSVITDAFFILPRYLEYVQQTRRSLPVLLVPYINELRSKRKLPLLPESHFFAACNAAQRPLETIHEGPIPEDFDQLARRLRHMYQVGLLNLLKGKQSASALGMMQRALMRFDVFAGARGLGTMTWVGGAALAAMKAEHMELTKSRKLLLSSIDRVLKIIAQQGASALDSVAPDTMINSLVYLLALADDPDEQGRLVLQTFEVESFDYSDDLLRCEREALKGPSANTVSSMATVLKDELRTTKDILENASQMGEGGLADYDELIETLTKVAEILAVVGLVSASNTLKEELLKIEKWKASPEPTNRQELLDVADALLYVESTVSGLEKLNLSDEELNIANSLARREVVASTQLAEAELLVIQEAESGLALVKRALNSYSESNYDSGHIQNVPATLISVRGGLVVLNFHRAAAVVGSCIAFVEDTLVEGAQTAAMQQLLETFADAIIGLEYYLEALRTDKDSDDSILAIAEDSLEALGYAPVEELQ